MSYFHMSQLLKLDNTSFYIDPVSVLRVIRIKVVKKN